MLLLRVTVTFIVPKPQEMGRLRQEQVTVLREESQGGRSEGHNDITPDSCNLFNTPRLSINDGPSFKPKERRVFFILPRACGGMV